MTHLCPRCGKVIPSLHNSDRRPCIPCEAPTYLGRALDHQEPEERPVPPDCPRCLGPTGEGGGECQQCARERGY